MNEYTIIIQVDANDGEEAMSINKVSDLDLEVLSEMLLDIQSHRGYYLKNRPRRKPYEPTARELYRKHEGWDVFESLIPEPISGFTTILCVRIFREEPIRMDML